MVLDRDLEYHLFPDHDFDFDPDLDHDPDPDTDLDHDPDHDLDHDPDPNTDLDPDLDPDLALEFSRPTRRMAAFMGIPPDTCRGPRSSIFLGTMEGTS